MSTKVSSKRAGLNPQLSNRLLWLLLLVLLIVLNIGFQLTRKTEPHDGETWIVNRVINGQTVEASQASNATAVVQRVRLIGISAPLKEQAPWGDRAQQRLEELVKEQQVVFEFDVKQKDNFDRFLVYIWKGDSLINAQLVEEGFVLVDSLPPNIKYKDKLDRAQAKARLLEAGIWDPKSPLRLSPKEYRRLGIGLP